MQNKSIISFEEAHRIFNVDFDKGVLYWKVRTTNRIKIGDEVGGHDCHGYKVTSVNGKQYKVHRIIWLMAHGEWPKDQIDHINGIHDDNRLINLRNASNLEQRQNIAKRKINNPTASHIGVYFDSSRKKYAFQLYGNNKLLASGRFNTEKEAINNYLLAKEKFHKFNSLPR